MAARRRYWPGRAPHYAESSQQQQQGSGAGDAVHEDSADDMAVMLTGQRHRAQATTAQAEKPRRVVAEVLAGSSSSSDEANGDGDGNSVDRGGRGTTAPLARGAQSSSEDEEERAARRARILARRRAEEGSSSEDEVVGNGDAEATAGAETLRRAGAGASPAATQSTAAVGSHPGDVSRDGSDDADASSSEWETDSDDSQDGTGAAQPVLLRPVFVPKEQRVTMSRHEAEAEAAEKQAVEAEAMAEKRVAESKRMLVAVLSEAPARGSGDDASDAGDGGVNTDVGESDEEAEEQAWRQRELARLRAEREEERAEERAAEERARRSAMTEAERRQIDREKDAEAEAQARREKKSRPGFLQRYYHKGAFYQDQEILQRDFSAPTGEDKIDKSTLPALMQRKNFARRGGTKWTHLANEDTSGKRDDWLTSSKVRSRPPAGQQRDDA